MIPPIERIFEIEDEYLGSRNFLPTSVSDWHLSAHNYKLPEELIKAMPSENKISSSAYLFSDNRNNERYKISEYLLLHHDTNISSNQIAILQNGTSAIHALLSVLCSQRNKRVTIIGPYYFSISSPLNAQNASQNYFFTTHKASHRIDSEQVISNVLEQGSEICIITDPVFCIGSKNTSAVLKICEALTSKGIICVIDSSAGGFDQNSDIGLFEIEYLMLASNNKLSFYIDSPTKRLLCNGFKHAVIFGAENTLRDVEAKVDYFAGGFSRDQVRFAQILYSGKYIQSVADAQTENSKIIQDHYDLLKALCCNTGLHVPERQSGMYTTVFWPNLTNMDINPTLIFRQFLFHLNLRIIPTQYFGFSPLDKCGVRVNLFRPSADYNALVQAMLEFDPKVR